MEAGWSGFGEGWGGLGWDAAGWEFDGSRGQLHPPPKRHFTYVPPFHTPHIHTPISTHPISTHTPYPHTPYSHTPSPQDGDKSGVVLKCNPDESLVATVSSQQSAMRRK